MFCNDRSVTLTVVNCIRAKLECKSASKLVSLRPFVTAERTRRQKLHRDGRRDGEAHAGQASLLTRTCAKKHARRFVAACAVRGLWRSELEGASATPCGG